MPTAIINTTEATATRNSEMMTNAFVIINENQAQKSLHSCLHSQGEKQGVSAFIGEQKKACASVEGYHQKTPENGCFTALSGVGNLGRETGLEPATYRATI